MKTLSIRQPYATLVCAGVKRVENRSWTTDYRGRLLIHASGEPHAYPDLNCLPDITQKKAADYFDGIIDKSRETILKNYDNLLEKAYIFYGRNADDYTPPEEWLKDAIKKYGWFMPSQAIIGEATLSDIITNSKDDFAYHGEYHWIMSDPVLYDKPIKHVQGRLRLWNFEKTA